MNKFRICHLYPEEMNIYGDTGNVLTLVKRLEWRGYSVEIDRVGLGETYSFSKADLMLGGGGQDRGQILVAKDLARKANDLKAAHLDGLPMLAICGTYQLFGHHFRTLDETLIEGIGLIDMTTQATERRMVGNIVINTSLGSIVGFENHSGASWLSSNVQPLGSVIRGYGNNGEDGTEGVRSINCFGTYLHGPVLVKNPNLADQMISLALTRKTGRKIILKPLDDSLEEATALEAASRP